MTMQIALFDLDHTLIPFDSDYEWNEFTIALGWRDGDSFRRANDNFFAQYCDGTLNIHDYVRFATQAIRDKGATESIAAHARFMADRVLKGIQKQALDLVRGHQNAGDTVVIVTATNEFVTRPIADVFGVKELIAIELVRDAQGEFTGDVLGTPSFREGKVTRVEAWLAARNLKWQDVETTFYSDSMNDLPLLEQVTHAVAVDPDPNLRAEAEKRGWPVITLRS